MSDRKLFLHQVLKQDQEPFLLGTYISDRRSQLNKPTPSSLRNRRTENCTSSLCNLACFLAFQNSPDVPKSPCCDYTVSPCRSPNRAVFLHIPSPTAAVLVEAAMRIQKQQKPKSGAPIRSVGFGLVCSFVKRLKDRSKSKRCSERNHELNVLEDKAEENATKSCSYSGRRISSAEWTEDNDAKSMDFEASASTSSYSSELSEDYLGLSENRYCVSPFIFSLHKSVSSNLRRTPECCSPAASPTRRVTEDQESHESQNLDRVGGEENEQPSPVSVLDPVFHKDNGPENGCDDIDEYDVECSSYANVQKAKEQLLYRLRRFEKLAALDTMELERKLLEESDNNDQSDEPWSPCRYPNADTVAMKVVNELNLESVPADLKKLVYDLIAEEMKETGFQSLEGIVGRIHKRMDSWKEVELDTIDMMIGLDMRMKKSSGRCDEWTKFIDQVEETAVEMGVDVCGVLVDELLEELSYMDECS